MPIIDDHRSGPPVVTQPPHRRPFARKFPPTDPPEISLRTRVSVLLIVFGFFAAAITARLLLGTAFALHHLSH